MSREYPSFSWLTAARIGISAVALGAIAPLRGNRLLHPALCEWVSSYKRVLRIRVIAVVTLVLVFWDRRTGK